MDNLFKILNRLNKYVCLCNKHRKSKIIKKQYSYLREVIFYLLESNFIEIVLEIIRDSIKFISIFI